VKKKETEFLTEEEAQAILRVPDRRTLQGKRDYAILLTLLTTGLRKAEICNLKVGDLKTYRNQAIIDVVGKGVVLAIPYLTPWESTVLTHQNL
jgi:integrase/recombinase XerD